MTDPRPDPEALAALDNALLGRLRRAAAEARFDGALIARAESVAPGHFDAVRLPLVQGWLRALDDPAAVWARLFAYRDAVPTAMAHKTLGQQVVRALTDTGALVDDPAGVRSRLRLMPFADLLIASDEVDARHDPVMGPGATTIELWRATAVRPGARVLDVGCGAGSLALAAAKKGAGEVVGVDLDPRAVAFARFNARLGDLPAARFEVGDLLAPVAGEQFDLALSQPPFVTQPPSVEATTYLHGGARGDELALKLIAQLPGVLAPGGRALVLFDTAPPPGMELSTRIRTAVASQDIQAIAVDAPGLDADQQAVGYAAAAHSDLGPEYGATARAYRAHLRELEITRMRHVLLELRRPLDGESRFFAAVEPRGSKIYDAGALAELRDGLRLASSEDLLAAQVRLSPHAWLVQEQSLAAAATARYRVRFEQGRARDQDLSDAAVALIDALAQAANLREAVERYAQTCGTTADEIEPAVLTFVRDALVSGLLVQAEG